MKLSIKFILLICIVLVAGGALFQALDVRNHIETTGSHYPFQDIVEYDPDQKYLPEPSWGRLLFPEQAGWSSEKLKEVESYAKSIGTDALLVVYNGSVVVGFGKYDAKFKLHSVRKSLMSVMYGIYSDKGVLDINRTLAELNIDDVDGLTKREKQASVGDLLVSKSGIYHAAAYETQGMRERRPKRGAYRAGENWFYNNWDFNALVTIFNEQTKTDFFEAFASQLATPLGMEQFDLEDTHYRYEREKSSHPAYLFKMSALDLARVGLLYLRMGEFNGQQIVSKDWIDLSTSPVHRWKEEKPTAGYGYMWQVTSDGFYAAGRGGQRLYVVPKYDLVIAHLVDTTGGKKVKNSNVKKLYKMILGAYKPEERK